MQHDAQGVAISAASAAAAAAFDEAVVGYRADTSQRLHAAIAADPEFGLAHCLKGRLDPW